MALEVVLNGGKQKPAESDVSSVRLEIDLDHSANGNEFSYIQLIQERKVSGYSVQYPHRERK